MKDLILKHALKNALEFNGKANPNAVLGRVLGENQELKKDVPKLRKDIEIVIKGLEKLTVEEQMKKLKSLAPEMLKEKKEEKRDRLEVPNAVMGKVVTRFAPSSSGPLHIGHSYVLSLNSELARKYQGKFILRMEDTNPENIYDKAYEMQPQEAQWLTKNNVAQVVIQSERLGIYYDYADKLVNMGKAYVCTCNSDKMKTLKAEGKACPCRDLEKKEQQIRYAKMFNEFAEGEAVLRLKTNLEDPNPALRDFPLMRINEHVHPKTQKKNRVWPLMNFSVAIDDALLGVTHCVRAKEHMDNGKKQRILHQYLNLPTPTDVYVGRINFTDMRVSKSKTRLAIERKEFTGWEDIRLPFIVGLKRRGFQPDAFIKQALDIGLTQTDKTTTKADFFQALENFNREIIEPMANRYFFVQNKKKIKVKKAPEQECEVPLHQDFRDRGSRKFKTKTDFLIAAKDFERLKTNHIHRLMDCLNFIKKDKGFEFHSTDYEAFKNAPNKGIILHWLPADEETVNVEILMEDNTKLKGLGEHRLNELHEGDIIQFERHFFAKLDKKDKNKLYFWYLHK